ncbi:hypothetical protein [Chlamydia trachomatis]|uniref:Uncharacterized protein n=3 Tax=Chlamydia trachomatis TaxID=813 RepID=O84504_CHLTR|nr:hypothetical protein [Chlamydia trachomatis]NP_220011.1 hypothetical protein CT_496.1 [Chlamydia trachomatis D/UW-3/CX]AAC68130.1 hypothetical protein CT_496.1 [Chlamydia trachomatis D/UW-3/CX]ADH17279.1 hypothetical protein E150_02635 [Chlamydia trachomatis E/150]ADH18203.1 hypothetical protein G9768_02610 [Chlamydia trachomatis G/9768]ADH19127.1 hypothetical protein G11222_02620 [Chlamydia trachomatis G/11222]ADH20051.1 hypothetical protein G11074_02615 [Chlamydia trachomatis G/11074]
MGWGFFVWVAIVRGLFLWLVKEALSARLGYRGIYPQEERGGEEKYRFLG